MPLSDEDQLLVETVRRQLANKRADDVLDMFGVVLVSERAFAPDGTLTECGKAMVEEIKKARPHLAPRIDAFVASGGTIQP